MKKNPNNQRQILVTVRASAGDVKKIKRHIADTVQPHFDDVRVKSVTAATVRRLSDQWS